MVLIFLTAPGCSVLISLWNETYTGQYRAAQYHAEVITSEREARTEFFRGEGRNLSMRGPA